MTWATDFHFEVTPKPEAVSPWASGAISSQPKPVELQPYQIDENLKKQYGIELAKTTNPFEAGCKLFGDDTSKALWVSFHWASDPIVVASKDIYLKTLKLSSLPLDREQLAAKVLELAEGEPVSRDGRLIPTIEPKERINAFKLYSEILGYTGKVEIDNSTKTFNHNEMKILLVKPKAPEPVTIEAANVKSEVLNANVPSPISLKLVKAG